MRGAGETVNQHVVSLTGDNVGRDRLRALDYLVRLKTELDLNLLPGELRHVQLDSFKSHRKVG